MKQGREIAIWAGIVFGVAALVLMLTLSLFRGEQPITLTGVVMRQDSDPRKQKPISGVEVTATNGREMHASKSDDSGYFSLSLRPALLRGQPMLLTFEHPEYKSMNLTPSRESMLYIVRMSAIPRAPSTVPSGPVSTIGQVSIRYSVKSSTVVDVGSAAKTFEVVNTGNMYCSGKKPCSPDGKWKATVGAFVLDAGEGNQFRNPRISCIAGPCPFTKIDSSTVSENGRTFNVSVRDWSDPATFLVEAEVVHPMNGDIVRQSYPAILGRNFNFTMPAEAEGVSIEAEVNGTHVVFPLDPGLSLSWAECTLKIEKDQTGTYRCELKPGFEFR